MCRPAPVCVCLLTFPTGGCQQWEGPHTRWMQHQREGHCVCVECQPPAVAAGQKHFAGGGNSVETGETGENVVGGNLSILHEKWVRVSS